MATIFHLFNIKTSSPEAVFDALTTEAGLQGWWTTAASAEPCALNATATFPFTPNYSKQMKITGIETGKSLRWECIAGDPEWLGTTIRFVLEPREDGQSVDVRFRHEGWEAMTDMYAVCNYHWGLYMKSLKSLIESGTGTPHVLPLTRSEN